MLGLPQWRPDSLELGWEHSGEKGPLRYSHISRDHEVTQPHRKSFLNHPNQVNRGLKTWCFSAWTGKMASLGGDIVSSFCYKWKHCVKEHTQEWCQASSTVSPRCYGQVRRLLGHASVSPPSWDCTTCLSGLLGGLSELAHANYTPPCLGMA